MTVRVLSAPDVRDAVDMTAAIDAMRNAFSALSAGRADAPQRTSLAGDDGTTLIMPARLSSHVGAKLVSVFEGNRARGLPVVNGVFVLLHGDTGAPRAILEGASLTAIRTGAASGLATDLLARNDARVLAVIGAGRQARTQIEAVRAVRPIEAVRVVARDPAHAAALAAELEGVDATSGTDPAAAVQGADIVVTATTSARPVFPASALPVGCHINAIGSFSPDMREVPGEVVGRSRVVVDSREAALAEAGDVIQAIREGFLDEDSLAELGEVVNGTVVGRTTPDQATLFKSVGVAVQDVALAAVVMERAEELRLGTEVDWS